MPTRGEDDCWHRFSLFFWVSPGLTRQHTLHISFPGICLGSPPLHIVRHLFIPAHEAKMHPRARHPDHGHSRANVPAGQNPEMPTRGKDDCCQSCSWFCWVSLGSLDNTRCTFLFALVPRSSFRTMRRFFFGRGTCISSRAQLH